MLSLKKDKSSGKENLTAEILKEFNNDTKCSYLNSTSVFVPNALKVARIIPIFKGFLHVQ